MTLHNLLVYDVQVLILIAACGSTMGALRISAPRARLLSLQALLGLCLFLPLLQPRVAVPGRVTAVSLGTFAREAGAAVGRGFVLPSPTTIATSVVVAGIVLRIGWIFLGLFRLSRYRDRAALVPLAHESIQKRLGVRASFYLSNEVAGPVTFGFRDPVVLLPAAYASNEFAACHELIHVRRRDWIVALFEQIVLALFWFHPAVWWLVSRIQLLREQAVDHEVVRLLESRDGYLQTLLEIASTHSQPDLIPATLFLRKRHLRERVASLLEEVSMTRFRLFSSAAALVAVAAVAILFCVRALPLQAAPGQDDSSYISISTGPYKLLHRSPVQYPEAAFEKHVEGGVVLAVSLDDQGEVSDAHVVSGPGELRAAALASVLQWHFAKDANLAPQFEVAIQFRVPAAGTGQAASQEPWPAGLPTDKSLNVSRIDLNSLPPALRDRVTPALTLHEGQEISWADMAQLSAAMKQVDEHLMTTIGVEENGNAVIRVSVSGTDHARRIRVGGSVEAANVLKKVVPKYPTEAKMARIQGIVRLNAVIGKDGSIKELELVDGPPELVQATLEAVRQWVYKPTLLNGDPVEVVTTIDVNYTLAP